MHFSSVVLPEPLWPIRPREDPSAMSNDTSRSAQNSSDRERDDEQSLLEGCRTLPVQPEHLRDAVDPDRGGHSSSAKSPDRWKNERHASSRSSERHAEHARAARRPASAGS